MQVSVILLTFNEEHNLPRCLDALSWCDDIIVVDSGSTDSTCDIALARGARVLLRPFDNFANQRNFGLAEGRARHHWVLHLDADEVVTPAFYAKLKALTEIEGIDAYRVPSMTMLHERWLRHAGMYPSYQVRLGHRERLRFVQVGHGQREDVLATRIGVFDEPYLHYNFSRGLESWLRKHIAYARDEATLILAERRDRQECGPSLFSRDSTSRRRALKSLAHRMPLLLRPLVRFFYILVWCRGFLDGRHGLLYAAMLSVYEGMIGVFVYAAILAARQDASRFDGGGVARVSSCARKDSES